ncbi:MAG: FG-GAP-like repeat-containing protein [Acidobacteriota bacterium]
MRYRIDHQEELLFVLLLTAVVLGLALPAMAAEVPFGGFSAIEDPFDGAVDLGVADLDGDGDLDLFGSAEIADDVAWWENTAGDGSAWSRHDLELDFDLARGVAVGDLDGDGDADLVGAAFFSSAILWWENDLGSGAACGGDFCEHTVDGSAFGANAVALADIDRDGDLDVVGMLRAGDAVVWYENPGDGSNWTQHIVDPDFEGAQAVALADLDGDGDTDILGGTGEGGGEFSWFENDLDGAGPCPADWCEHILDTGNTASVAIADLDGDGDLDLLRTSISPGAAWWENTAGDGSAWTEQLIPISMLDGRAISTTDLDGDGDLDVLTDGRDLAVWLENTNGDGSAWTERFLGPGDGFKLLAADLDGDGDLDLAGASRRDDVVGWWENRTPHRSAVFPDERTIGTGLQRASSVTTADIDGDGDLDVLTAAELRDEVACWENTSGTGTAWTKTTIDGGFLGARSVAAADLDGDGDLDALGAAFHANAVDWWENTAGDCTSWIRHQVATGFRAAWDAQAADLDRDGDLDIIAMALWADDIAWWENTLGDGSVWTRHDIALDFDGAASVLASDIDRDGDIDLVGAAAHGDDIAWWENTAGDGSVWVHRDLIRDLDGASSVAAADIDRDGDIDILSAAQHEDAITWWENTMGDGSAWSRRDIDLNFEGAFTVAAEDLDGDGDEDVLGASGTNGGVIWWENVEGDGSIWNRQIVDSNFAGSFDLAVGDLDGNSIPDLLAVGGGNRVAWWENRGGHFALPTLDAVTSPTPNDGTDDLALLRIDGVHRGRLGDEAAELATLELKFEETEGDPLSDSELNALVDSLMLFRDDGDAIFEPTTDDTLFFTQGAPFALTNGVLTLTMIDGDPHVLLAHGSDQSWWLAADISPSATTATPETFQVSHVTSASSSGEMAANDTPLVLEFQADISSSSIEINDPPVVSSPIADQTVDTGVAVNIEVAGSFADEEMQTLSFEAVGLPDSLTLSPAGVITGTPTLGDVGASPHLVMVTATDPGGLTVSDTFLLSVDFFGGTIVVDGACTLKDAIESANANLDQGNCHGAGGVETIRLDVDVTLTAADTAGSSNLGGEHAGLPDIASEVILRAGAAVVVERDASLPCVADGSDQFRLFNIVSGGRLVLEGLTLRGGCAQLGGAIHLDLGAAIEASGCLFENNVAQADSSDSIARGGAIHAASQWSGVTIADSEFQNNHARAIQDSAAGSGGALFLASGAGQPAMLIDSGFSHNTAASGPDGDAHGGAIFAALDALGTIAGCTFSQNQALGGAGATGGGSGLGGALYAWEVPNVSETSFHANLARGGHGGSGFGGLAVGGAVFKLDNSGSWSGLIFDGNQAVGGSSDLGEAGRAQGGGLFTNAVELTRSYWFGNLARGGDGVVGGAALGGAALVNAGSWFEDATVASNRARGGDATSGAGGDASGGGLTVAGSTTLRAMTLTDNEARGGDSSGGGTGGLAFGGAIEGRVQLQLSHSTLTENRVLGGLGDGGGGTAEGGGLWIAITSSTAIDNTALAGNSRTSGGGSPTAEDCHTSAPIGSLGHNLVQTPGNCTFAATHDQVGVDPLLAPLAELGCTTPLPNGSCLPVHAVSLGSPALDQGSCAISSATRDVRGFLRPFDHSSSGNADDSCDVGAHELVDSDGNGIDDALQPDLIFVDGFESGGTGRWSFSGP